MLSDPQFLMSCAIFLPLFWGLGLFCFPARAIPAMRVYAVVGTVVELLVTIQLAGLALGYIPEAASAAESIARRHDIFGMTIPWIPTWNVNYSIGVDGFSLPLILMTSGLFVLAMLASRNIATHVRGYLFLMLLSETGTLGVFFALDFFLFFVMWGVMLLPMYFLIGLWGGPRKEYAAIKFFLYTLAGGICLLIAMLMLYFAGNGSFDLLELARLGQGRALVVQPLADDETAAAAFISPGVVISPPVQFTAFVLLLIAFGIKLPVVPLHTWLPDAHVEAPTPVSMILAGVLLKLGGFGILRIAIPICPVGFGYCAWFIVGMGAFCILYGALAALAQTDFKRLVAYSSVSHMGYVLLGLGAFRFHEITGSIVKPEFAVMGVSAAMFQMVSHGILSAGMFFVVGVLYDRVHHRDLRKFGGITALLPHYSGLAAGLFFAGMGLPGMCGFIGEIFSIFAAWNIDRLFSVAGAVGMILTAGYILWALQRVYLGAEYVGPHPEKLTPVTRREFFVAYVLLAFAIGLGVFPAVLLNVVEPAAVALVEGVDGSAGRIGQNVWVEVNSLDEESKPRVPPTP